MGMFSELLQAQDPQAMEFDDTVGTALSKGWSSGLRGAGSQLQSVAGMAGELVGADDFAKERYTDSDALRQEAQQYAPQVGRWDDVHGGKDFLRYAAGLVGGSAPVSLAAMGASALTGGAAIPGLLAATGAIAPFEIGDAIQKQQADPTSAERPLGERALGVGLGGLGSAAFQSIVPHMAASKLLRAGAPGLAQQSARGLYGKNVGGALALEGVAEGGGDALKQVGANPDAPLDWASIKENTIGGAVAGGAMGHVGFAGEMAHRVAPQIGEAYDSAKTSINERLAAAKAGTEGKLNELGETAPGKKVKSAFEDMGELMGKARTKIDDTLGKMTRGEELGSPQDWLNATTDEAKKRMTELSDSEKYKATMKWGKEMLDSAGLDEAKRAELMAAMANAKDSASQMTVATMKKAWDLGQAAAKRVNAFADAVKESHNKYKRKDVDAETKWTDINEDGSPVTPNDWARLDFNGPTDEAAPPEGPAPNKPAPGPWDEIDDILNASEAQQDVPPPPRVEPKAWTINDRKEYIAQKMAEGMTKDEAKEAFRDEYLDQSKKSEDYSGADKAIHTALIESGLAQRRPDLFDNNDSINEMASALRLIGEMVPKGPLSPKVMDRFTDVFGTDSLDVLETVLNALSGNKLDSTAVEKKFAVLNQIEASRGNKVKMHDKLAAMLSPDAQDTEAVQDPARILEVMTAHARGETTKGKGAAETQAINTRFANLTQHLFGDNADRAYEFVEKHARQVKSGMYDEDGGLRGTTDGGPDRAFAVEGNQDAEFDENGNDIDTTSNEAQDSEVGYTPLGSTAKFDDQGNRIEGEQQHRLEYGLTKPDVKGKSKSKLNGRAMPEGSQYANQHQLDLERQYSTLDADGKVVRTAAQNGYHVYFERLTGTEARDHGDTTVTDKDGNTTVVPGAKMGRIVVEDRRNPGEFSAEDLDGMKLDTTAFPNSRSRLEIGGHIVDATRIASVAREKIQGRTEREVPMNYVQRMIDGFKQGIAMLNQQFGEKEKIWSKNPGNVDRDISIARLTELRAQHLAAKKAGAHPDVLKAIVAEANGIKEGKGGMIVPDSTVIGFVTANGRRKPMTWGEAKKLDFRTPGEKNSDKIHSNINDLRKQYQLARRAGEPKEVLAAIKEDIKDAQSDLDWMRNKDLAAGDDIVGSERPRLPPTERKRNADGSPVSYDDSVTKFDGNWIEPDYHEINRAVDAGATIITDTFTNRKRIYNLGERKVAKHLKSQGYAEIEPGLWTPGGQEPASDGGTGFKLTPRNEYTGKDQHKANRATHFIGRGHAKSSTAAYARDAKSQGVPVNAGKYGPEDYVFVSSNGSSSASKNPKYVPDSKDPREQEYVANDSNTFFPEANTGRDTRFDKDTGMLNKTGANEVLQGNYHGGINLAEHRNEATENADGKTLPIIGAARLAAVGDVGFNAGQGQGRREIGKDENIHLTAALQGERDGPLYGSQTDGKLKTGAELMKDPRTTSGGMDRGRSNMDGSGHWVGVGSRLLYNNLVDTVHSWDATASAAAAKIKSRALTLLASMSSMSEVDQRRLIALAPEPEKSKVKSTVNYGDKGIANSTLKSTIDQMTERQVVMELNRRQAMMETMPEDASWNWRNMISNEIKLLEAQLDSGKFGKGMARSDLDVTPAEASKLINELSRKYKDVIMAPGVNGESLVVKKGAIAKNPVRFNKGTAVGAERPANATISDPYTHLDLERDEKANQANANRGSSGASTQSGVTLKADKARAARQDDLEAAFVGTQHEPVPRSTDGGRVPDQRDAPGKDAVDARRNMTKATPEQLAALVAARGGPTNPKAVAAKKAAFVERAASGDKALIEELSTSDDAKGLQRAAELLAEQPATENIMAVTDAINDRLSFLMGDPDVAYSMETTNPNTNAKNPQTSKDIREYIEKVLGHSVKLAWAKFTHAGEFRRTSAGDIIRLSVHALNPMSTAYHESLHAFFAQLRDAGAHDIIRVVEAAARSPHIMKQIREFYKNQPDVLNQLKDPEERAAYMYQLWAAGHLDVNPQVTTVFQKIAKFIRQVLGTWSNDERALHIMKHFNDGSYAQAMGTPNAMKRAMMEPGRNRVLETAKSFTEPLGRLADAVIGTGAGRLRDTGIPALADLAKMIKKDALETGLDHGYLPAARIEATKRLGGMVDVLGGYAPETLKEALEALESGSVAASAEGRLAVDHVKGILKVTRDYMVSAGVKIGNLGKDYFPRVWDVHYISKNEQAFRDMLEPYVRSGQFKGNVTDFLQSLTSRDGNEFGIEASSPGMQFKKKRELAFLKAEDVAPFLNKDLMGTMASYITQATRKAEWERRFGYNANDPDVTKLEALFNQAKQQGATKEHLELAEQYIKGIDGTLGDTLNPTARRLIGNLVVYQNIRLLPMAAFSMVIDPLGVMVRGGNLAQAYDTLKRGVASIRETYGGKAINDEATRLAEMVGVVDKAILGSIVGDVYTQGMVGGVMKKANDAFFKYNMVEGLNRAFRVGASEAAMSFMAKHAGLTASPHSERWMGELGIRPGDIKLMPNGRIALSGYDGLTKRQEKRVHAAINQWVDGAVLRPNAADKPIWMNDPHFALLAHLKQFIFAFQQTILTRVVHEFKHGNYAPAMALGAYVPVMIAADTVKGILQGGGDTPEWKKNWDVADYIGYGVQRAGLLGVGQFGLDVATDVGRGGTGVGALSGPTIEQLGDALQTAGGRKQFGSTLIDAMPANALYKEVFTGGSAKEVMFED